MKRRLPAILRRSLIYQAVLIPHPLTIALMCRLNDMPYNSLEARRSLAWESDEPLDMR